MHSIAKIFDIIKYLKKLKKLKMEKKNKIGKMAQKGKKAQFFFHATNPRNKTEKMSMQPSARLIIKYTGNVQQPG